MGSEFEDLVTVRVDKHLPVALSVVTENGQHAILGVREISWDSGRRKNGNLLCTIRRNHA